MKKLYSLLFLALASISPALAQWNTNATPVCIYSTTYVDENGETKTGGDYYATNVMVARTPDKKTWLAWKTWGRKIVNDQSVTAVRTYLQLLDRDGVPQFEKPIMVNDHMTPTWWSTYSLCVASDGSAIVTVADSRTEEATWVEMGNSAFTFTPAIYKVDQEGNFLWGLDGVEFTDFTKSPFTSAYVVGDDTYFLFNYADDDDGDHSADGMYMMRIDNDGTKAWDKPRLMAPGLTTKGQIVPSTDGEFLYFDDTPDGARVHRFDRELNEVWGEPVIYDEYSYGGYELNHYKLLPDGQGGACVAFLRPMGDFAHNVRAQHINGDGSLGFGLTALDCYAAEMYDHNYPNIAVNTETQEILVQFASDLGATGCVMHQKFTFDGDYAYELPAMQIASKNAATSNGYMFGLTGVGSLPGGDWIAVYRDLAAYNRESIVIRRYDKDGNRVWSKTIGRDLGVEHLRFIVEPEAIYLFYRESRENKNPGINIFRIGADGTYDVTYPEEDAIHGITDANPGEKQYFSIDGKRYSQPQKGLNIVRQSDGTMKKQLIY